MEVQWFGPMACCNIIYKVLAKVLCNRLNVCLYSPISENQCAFISTRSIRDGILYAHEMVRSFRKKDDSNMCIKIDLWKAYDTVNRQFMTHMLTSLRFSDKWINLIIEMINLPTFSIFNQGTAEGYFKSSNGLRQGDPLSSILFTIIMEFFTLLMDEKVSDGQLNVVQS